MYLLMFLKCVIINFSQVIIFLDNNMGDIKLLNWFVLQGNVGVILIDSVAQHFRRDIYKILSEVIFSTFISILLWSFFIGFENTLSSRGDTSPINGINWN